MTHKLFVNNLGHIVSEHRTSRKKTQDGLAAELHVSRTMIAHLEEGRELPQPHHLTSICRALEIPEEDWVIATHGDLDLALNFEESLSELIGRPVTHASLTGIDQYQAASRIKSLFGAHDNEAQAHAKFNATMVCFGERPVSAHFFSAYLGPKAFHDLPAFEASIRHFQGHAMRLYGNFRRAWTRLSQSEELASELEPLQPVPLEPYKGRTPFNTIKEIASDRLPELGYIAVNRIREQNRERAELANYLTQLADAIERTSTSAAIDGLEKRRLLRLQTLLRRFDITNIELEHNLFAQIDPEALRSEADRITPEEQDLVRIDETQRQGLRNLSAYLTEPYLDVYVATSMREDAEFISVNAFVEQLFSHADVAPLHLRYFNPTQSWIEDRVSKGLVEALMLRRSIVTVYMAQKSDTFGKDSEASVALGQGKTVIVYVPRLFDDLMHVDSQRTYALSDAALDEELARLNVELEEGLDRKAKARQILLNQLSTVSADGIKRIVSNHWADFDLYGELARISNANLRKECSAFLRAVRLSTNLGDVADPENVVKAEIIDRLVSTADSFESRARTFRDIHPLSLQVIVRSGVVNGILVTRSVDACAKVLCGVIGNTLKTSVQVDGNNYRLVEEETKSTLRVVSRHCLLTNAFWSQYFDKPAHAVHDALLDASTI